MSARRRAGRRSCNGEASSVQGLPLSLLCAQYLNVGIDIVEETLLYGVRKGYEMLLSRLNSNDHPDVRLRQEADPGLHFAKAGERIPADGEPIEPEKMFALLVRARVGHSWRGRPTTP